MLSIDICYFIACRADWIIHWYKSVERHGTKRHSKRNRHN